MLISIDQGLVRPLEDMLLQTSAMIALHGCTVPCGREAAVALSRLQQAYTASRTPAGQLTGLDSAFRRSRALQLRVADCK